MYKFPIFIETAFINVWIKTINTVSALGRVLIIRSNLWMLTYFDELINIILVAQYFVAAFEAFLRWFLFPFLLYLVNFLYLHVNIFYLILYINYAWFNLLFNSSYSFKKSDCGINSELSCDSFSSSMSNSFSSSLLFERTCDLVDFDSSTESSSLIIWIVGSKTSRYVYSAFFLFFIKILFR